MFVRPIEEADWPVFVPIFREIVAAGETYAYPLELTPEQAWALWVEGPPGITVVAVVETNVPAVALWQDLGSRIIGTVPEAFDSASHGRVGLHVMHRYL